MRGEKTAAKIAEKYRQNVEKGVEKSFKEMEDLLQILSKYQNKSGTISKSKTRSKRSQAIVKQTMKDLKKFQTKKARVNFRDEKYVIPETQKRLEQKETLGLSGAGAAAAAQVFVKWTSQILPKHFMSELILALADSNYTGDDIINILKYLQSTMNSQVPEEMDKFKKEDDISLFVSNLSNIHEIRPDIPTEDAIKIADMMNYYGFDNVEDGIEKYYEDDNEEDEEDEDYDY